MIVLEKNAKKYKALNLLKVAATIINTRRGVYSPNKEYILNESQRIKGMLNELPANDKARSFFENRLRLLNGYVTPVGHPFRDANGVLKHDMHLRGHFNGGSIFERDWQTKKPIITSPRGVIYDEQKNPIKSVAIGDNKSPLSIVHLPNNYKMGIFNFPEMQTSLLINNKNYGRFPCINCRPLAEKKFNIPSFVKSKQNEGFRVFHGENFNLDKHKELLNPIMEALDHKRQGYLGGGTEKESVENVMRWIEKTFK